MDSDNKEKGISTGKRDSSSGKLNRTGHSPDLENPESRQKTESSLQQQLLFNSAINSIAEIIRNCKDHDEILEKANRILGETLQLDRALIYYISFDENYIEGLCEWLKDDHPDIEATKNRYSLDLFRKPFSRIRETQKYLISHSKSIDGNFLGDGSGEMLHVYFKIKSLIWYPFDFDGNNFYVFTLNQILYERTWTINELNFIDSVAKQMSLAFMKKKLVAEREALQESIAERIKTEEELKESRATLSLIINSFTDPVYFVSPDLDLIFANEAMKNQYGKNVLGKKCYQIIHNRSTPCDWCVYTKLSNENRIEKYEHYFEKQNQYIIVSNILLEDHSKLSIYFDMTERKKVKQALRESEEKFRNIFNLSQSMICLADIDTATFTTVNPAVTKILGYPEDELLHTTFLDFVHPDDKENTIQVIEDKLKAGETVFRFVNRYRCRDNTYKWLDWNAHSVPEKGITYAVANDITELKKTEQSLKESKEKLDLIVNESPFPIAVTDADDQIVHYWSKSAEELTGYTPGTVSEWYELAYPDPEYRRQVIERWKPFLEQAKKENKAVNTGEYQITCKDGSILIVELYAQFIPGNLVITIHDMTKLKEDEARIQKQLKEKEILLKEVHHRVKNNIVNIENLLFMQSASSANTEVTTALEEAVSRVSSIRILYDKLLLTEDYREISIKSYLENFLESFVEAFSLQENITIKMHVAEFNINSRYAIAIGIIINELLTNAIKYAFKDSETGEIAVSVKRIEQKIEIVVKDNGIGIPVDIDNNKSTGFGTSLVKMLVEQMQGTYRIEREYGTKAIVEIES